jgi:hypothetical protein
MQYTPRDGIYVYFRYDGTQRIMCVMNTNKETTTVDLSRFSGMTNGYTKVYDAGNDVSFTLGNSLTLTPKSELVLELRK